ncbi:SDR family NAD(P)-dependent oxidoreductase [Flavisphingomonas formosensis]|uniref:SDR family NAD(P)-dependent oxidoreductase n=1 Tax=Flavisphingomonas formosensis TaxID=861534 RepID=UPI0012FBAE8F|nr:SDR family NAD(P)-dependent oxidoreductase [Sphingomonas formosensis]
MKTWLITGISRGFGLDLARAALARGDRVIGTVRSGTPDLPESDGRLHLFTLDMADPAGIGATVEAAFTLAGRIDVVVNNAGYGLLGAIETTSDADAEHLFAVDLFGPFRLIRAALPHLRAQRSGHILNITSIAGRAPVAGSALYAAAKHALEGFSAALAQEVAPFGIKVTAVAPGAFRTDFLSAHSLHRADAGSDAYAASVGRSLAAFDAMAGRQAGNPARAAEALLTIVDAKDPPLHLLLGSDALRRTREKLGGVIEEMDRWESLTLGTDYARGAAGMA